MRIFFIRYDVVVLVLMLMLFVVNNPVLTNYPDIRIVTAENEQQQQQPYCPLPLSYKQQCKFQRIIMDQKNMGKRQSLCSSPSTCYADDTDTHSKSTKTRNNDGSDQTSSSSNDSFVEQQNGPRNINETIFNSNNNSNYDKYSDQRLQHSYVNDDDKNDSHPKQQQKQEEDILSKLVQYPTLGQRIILVPKQSDLKIVLQDDIAYQLRQEQVQRMNIVSDTDSISYTSKDRDIRKTTKKLLNDRNNRLTVLPELSEAAMLLENEMTLMNQTTSTTKQKTENNDKANFDTAFRNGIIPLLLKSHPDQALVRLSSSLSESKQSQDGGFMLEQSDYIDIGIGPQNIEDIVNSKKTDPLNNHNDRQKKNPMIIYLQSSTGSPIRGSGSRNIIPGFTSVSDLPYTLMTNDGYMFIVSSSNSANVGSPITLTTPPSSLFSSLSSTVPEYNGGSKDNQFIYKDDNHGNGEYRQSDGFLSVLATDYDRRGSFIINEDGTISPFMAQHLVLGISRYPMVTLVERYSINRFLFHNAHTFFTSPAPVNGTLLELKSHKGLAVTYYPQYAGAYGMARIMDLVVGPANNNTFKTVQLRSKDYLKHHQFTLAHRSLGYLVPMNLKLELNVPIRMILYNVTKHDYVGTAMNWLLLSTNGATWIVNDEGSISPLLAPHLVLGCNYVADFVDNDTVASTVKERLMWQPSSSDTNNISGNYNRTTDGERMKHELVWFLFVEDFLYSVVVLAVFVVLIVIKLVPLQIWMTIVFHLCFGTAASTCYAGFVIGAFVTNQTFKYLKKRQTPAQAVPGAD